MLEVLIGCRLANHTTPPKETPASIPGDDTSSLYSTQDKQVLGCGSNGTERTPRGSQGLALGAIPEYTVTIVPVQVGRQVADSLMARRLG